MSKISDSIELIQKHGATAPRPALMCSFGKDSMVLAELIRRAFPSGLNGQHFPQAHKYPIDILYHRDPWFPIKHEFADNVIKSWGMVVHDFLPVAAGVKVKPDMIELVARYNLGVGGIDIPKNTLPPEAYPRRDYICGLNDWVLRPKSLNLPYLWDTVFIGHKSSDVDPFDGPVPLKSDMTRQGGVKLVFPLREWTDDDVWKFIETEHVPIQEKCYDKLTKHAHTWFSNDYTHACTACIDPRETSETVYCPKLKQQVPNVGHRVLQLKTEPDYIVRIPTPDDTPVKERLRNG